MNVLLYVNSQDLLHVFSLDKIHDLSAVCNYFKRLACHVDLFVFEDLPVHKPSHYSSENLIEVFVNWRMLVAKLFRLVEQVLA